MLVHIWILFGLIHFAGFSHAVAGEEVTTASVVSFSDLARLVREQSEAVKSTQALIEAAQTKTGHWGRSLLPRLTAQIGEESLHVGAGERLQKGYWRLGAELNLYRGGRDWLEESVREKSVLTSRIVSLQNQAIEIRHAQDTFWSIVALTQILVHRKEELALNEQNILSSARRAGAGVATPSDKLQFELFKEELQQEIESIEQEVQAAKSKLAVLLGFETQRPFAVNGSFPTLSRSRPQAKPLGQRLAVRELELREGIEKARAQAAGRWWHPRIDIYASHGVPALEHEYERAVAGEQETSSGLRLSFDFGQVLEDRSEIGAKSWEARSLAHRRARVAREIEVETQSLERALIQTARWIERTEHSLEKAKSYLALTKKEYQRGIKNGPDLLSANKQYFDLLDQKIRLQLRYQEVSSALEALNASEDQ